jgi:hypothetical protein
VNATDENSVAAEAAAMINVRTMDLPLYSLWQRATLSYTGF